MENFLNYYTQNGGSYKGGGETNINASRTRKRGHLKQYSKNVNMLEPRWNDLPFIMMMIETHFSGHVWAHIFSASQDHNSHLPLLARLCNSTSRQM